MLTGPLRGRGYSSRDDADERPHAARLNERSARRVLGQPCAARPSDGPGQAVTDDPARQGWTDGLARRASDDPARRVLNDPGRALTDGPTQTQHVPNGLIRHPPMPTHAAPAAQDPENLPATRHSRPGSSAAEGHHVRHPGVRRPGTSHSADMLTESPRGQGPLASTTKGRGTDGHLCPAPVTDQSTSCLTS